YMNENSGKYEGLTTRECRKQILKDLDECGAQVKTEPYAHNVGTCYRCHATVEPMISKQWFVSMKPLAEKAIEAVEKGEVKFVPERFDKIYFNWMNNIRDWCISRQLWWGHRIPAWYCDDCGEITVAETEPTSCCKCGHTHLHRDEDVLDTWFSSGMWPFSTLGWPDNTDALNYYYPTSTLVTGYDIIFFWIARMITFGTNVMGKKPFDTVYVHGIVRDDKGRKMSKSLGNGIDPLEVIETYGADALRFSLITGNSAGNDMRFYDSKVKSASEFCNKLYNASRFILMNVGDIKVGDIDMSKLDIADKWILHRLNTVTAQVRKNLDNFDLNIAAEKVYDFIWKEFCDWYIEMAKQRLYSDDSEIKGNVLAILIRVIGDSLKLLHPFMPFITEELYTHLPNSGETIMLTDFPNYRDEFVFDNECEVMESMMELIRSIRNIRAEMNVHPAKKTDMILVAANASLTGFCEQASIYFMRLAGANTVTVQTDKSGIPSNAVCAISNTAECFIPLAELVDKEKETERVNKELAKMESEIKRFEGKLNNPGFVSKAPEQVVREEREKLAAALEMAQKLRARLEQLKNL
ncbi:MAG: valine--tRNA ligase, partial [Clostridia bacterium]|nr:valine--tRNA ligase [Clostridia bacterium]